MLQFARHQTLINSAFTVFKLPGWYMYIYREIDPMAAEVALET